MIFSKKYWFSRKRPLVFQNQDHFPKIIKNSLFLLTDCVVECIIAHTGIDFESSTGASLLAIVTEIVGEGSKHPAKDSAYLKYANFVKNGRWMKIYFWSCWKFCEIRVQLVEKYAPAPPSDEKSERVKYLETLLKDKDIHFD